MRSIGRAAHGTLRQEGRLIRIAAGVVLSLLIVGCKAPPARVNRDLPASKPAPREGTVEAGAAEVTKYIDQPIRHRVWRLVWNSAKVNLKEGLRPEGVLVDVNATVFDEDHGVTTIHADKGVSSKDSAILSLKDHVIAKSAARDARLTCEALKWDPDRRILMATGNVRYHAGGLDAGPFPDVWASPDMERFGTPDTFGQDTIAKDTFAKEKANKP